MRGTVNWWAVLLTRYQASKKRTRFRKISRFQERFEISVEISGISGISAGFQGFQQDFNDRFEDFYAFPGELLHPKTAQVPGDGPCHLTIDRTVCARERTGSYMY